ncbi:MAG: valine--tRNA ligase [Clostridia bacterium]
MGKTIESKYNPGDIEDRIYQDWMEKGYFHAEPDPSKEPFCIVIPPPNITGQLHMGHALNNTIQDILVRMKRMQGFCTLWLPGTDHASIATEARIVAQMKEEGISKEDIGREGFLLKAWEWRNQYGRIIIDQLKKLGSSCDWERERFTMDEGLSHAVTEVFVRLYEKGLIYRGERIINWCPVCLTSISDAEVEHTEKEGNLWHIRYPVEGSDAYVVVATTRPETMLGDTGVAVHPEDERYAGLIGRTVNLPLMDRPIPVVGDDFVDREFGTGAVKVTPAHDPNDFEIGLRHGLAFINVMNDDGTMNENAGIFQGMDRALARKQIIAMLTEQDLLEDIKPHVHNVGECYRCNTVIEPKISLQWFVKMKPLAEPAIEAVKNQEVVFYPGRFEKTYFSWMENIRDWCISRQLWWGHRIPAYYCGDCGETVVSAQPPGACEKCGGGMTQDNDTLDTWFSSALWPFSTLGWPEKTSELEYFYPTSVLVTAYDILFFWVARMIFSGLEHMGAVPFPRVLMHGLIRDDQGRKMSKSMGNGIDPLDVIKECGTDALRFALLMGSSLGNDIRVSSQRIESGRNFANKIWNATRFVLMNFDDDLDFEAVSEDRFTDADKWILSRARTTILEVTENMEKYELGLALHKIHGFIWEEFCDWYIELAKNRLYDQCNDSRLEVQYVLNTVLKISMRLLHPFMPFITEEIHSSLIHGDASIMVAPWPSAEAIPSYPEQEKAMGLIMEIIRSIRNIRAEMGVPNARKAKIIFVTPDREKGALLLRSAAYFEKLASASGIEVLSSDKDVPGNAAGLILEGLGVYLPLTDLIDVEKEIKRLTAEKDKIHTEGERAKARLENPNFLSKAPEKLVLEEREKLAKYLVMQEDIGKRIEELKAM